MNIKDMRERRICCENAEKKGAIVLNNQVFLPTFGRKPLLPNQSDIFKGLLLNAEPGNELVFGTWEITPAVFIVIR